MKIYDMQKEIPLKIIDNFCNFMKSDHWLYGVPGGFCSNFPKRKVNAFGDGGYTETHWTAKMNANNVTLHSKPNKFPQCFKDICPYLKKLFLKTYSDAKITEETFSIGVCNYYTEPDMYISAHKDDNKWYPNECEEGPVFASITLYPDGEPNKEHFCRFQIKEKGIWKQINLPDKSVLIMPSNIEHRVLKHKKSQIPFFKPRINVTFRSVYPKKINPLMNLMAISNHARYYCMPIRITFPPDYDNIQEICHFYEKFCKKNNRKLKIDIKERDRSNLIKQYKKLNYPKFKITNNMVAELFEDIIKIEK